MKYRKRPIVIEALQFLCVGPIIQIPSGVCNCEYGTMSLSHVHTLEGIMNVEHGDWIITGIKGEKYPCKNDIFRLSYEQVTE